jgi:hypothetical protein
MIWAPRFPINLRIPFLSNVIPDGWASDILF